MVTQRNRAQPEQVRSHFKHEKSKLLAGDTTAKWQACRAVQISFQTG